MTEKATRTGATDHTQSQDGDVGVGLRVVALIMFVQALAAGLVSIGPLVVLLLEGVTSGISGLVSSVIPILLALVPVLFATGYWITAGGVWRGQAWALRWGGIVNLLLAPLQLWQLPLFEGTVAAVVALGLGTYLLVKRP